jgi:hypothetical protein
MRSESRRRLPNRHGNEKGAINRTSTAGNSPQRQAPSPSFSRDTQPNGSNVEPEHGCPVHSQLLFTSSLCTGASTQPLTLLSFQQSSWSRQKKISNTAPTSSSIEAWSKHNSCLHSPHVMDQTSQARGPSSRSLDDLVTQSPAVRSSRETSLSSLIDSRRTQVMNGESHLYPFLLT